jgi:hypothetical protein
MQIETNQSVTDETEIRVPMVTAIELGGIKRDRAHVEELRTALGGLVLDLYRREQDVIRRIEAGASIDGGAVVLHRRRQSISWLTVVAKELGHDAVERIKSAWPVAFWKELQIS